MSNSQKSIMFLVSFGGLLLGTSTAQANDFNWENMTHAWIKLSPDYEFSNRRIDSYMQVTRPETWKEVRENEFKRKAARAETLQLLKKRVAALKIDEDFSLTTNLELGTFDLEMNRFPIKSLTEDHYWYPGGKSSEDLPYTYNVYFCNTKDFRVLNMEPNQAESFINERTDRYGNVNRQVSATIRFRLKKPRNTENAFFAEIQSLTLYRDRTRTRVLAEMSGESVKRENGK